MPLNTFLVNGGSSPDLTQDIINDTSKQIASTDYYDIVISGLKVDKQYVSQFRWMYEDGSLGEWSNSYEFTTDDELDPAVPSTPILVTGVGFFTARWNGKNSSNQDLTDISRIDIYVSGGDFNASIPAASMATPGTVNISAKKGTYSVTFYAVRSSGKISNASSASSVTILTDSQDAATALSTAQQAALDAGIAQSTANGKNKVTYSSNEPGSTANTIGDIWYTYETSGIYSGTIVKQFTGNGGTSWTQTEISGLVVTNIDAGSITTGILSIGIGITGSNGSFNLDASTGILTASGVNVSGAITATSGSFTGSLYSTVGTIGGWTIGPDGLTANSVELKSQNSLSGNTNGAVLVKGSLEKYLFSGDNTGMAIINVNYSETEQFNILTYDKGLNDVILGNTDQETTGTTYVSRSAQVFSNNSASRGLRNMFTATAYDSSKYSLTAKNGDVLLIYTA
jgi:hypothetical protein